jgi:membrane protein DedA with SNARE-associated domain
MDYRWYAAVNLIGAVLWCGVTVLLGYFVGSLDIVQDYVTPVFDLALFVAIAAIIYAAVSMVRGRGKTGEDAG